jgi:hypothetical protein
VLCLTKGTDVLPKLDGIKTKEIKTKKSTAQFLGQPEATPNGAPQQPQSILDGILPNGRICRPKQAESIALLS